MPFLPMPVEGYGRPQCASATWEQKHSPAWCPGTMHTSPSCMLILQYSDGSPSWKISIEMRLKIKLFFILNLERYSQDDQGLSVFPQFRWSHPPTRWIQAVLNHFVLRPPLSRLNQKKGATPKRVASNQRRKISSKPVASSSGPTVISDSIVHWFVDKTTTNKLKSYVENSESWMSWICCSPLAAHCFNSNSCRSLLRENIPAVANSQVDPFFSKDGHPTSKSCPSAGGGQCFIGIACGKLAGSCTTFWPQRIPCWTGDL